jgi:glycine dehydrogenase subunit 1
MPFISNTDQQRQQMLAAIGVENFKDLLVHIPPKFIQDHHIEMDSPLSELEITQKISRLARQNMADANSFLGGGIYDHFVPAAVDHILLKPEFHTAYTPYQAEVSQGTLQYIYEYQTLICELTGMDISNAGMYDAATASAEAILMAVRKTKKEKAIIAGSIHPTYLKVIKSYTEGIGVELETIPTKDGVIDLEALQTKADDNTACVLVQTPNFLGNLEDMFAIEKITHSTKKALLIVSVDPISLPLLNCPSEYKADVVVGEAQGLGNAMNFGGPLIGFFATTAKLTRSMPGRIVGATVDAKGEKSYALTLQAREQHIRRAKATSNICSNDALCSLAATVYLSLMGRQGLRQVAEQSASKAHYLANEIDKLPGYSLAFQQPFFKEFTIQTPRPAEKIIEKLRAKKIFPGIDLARFDYAENLLLIAVTEKKSKADLDELIAALQEVK